MATSTYNLTATSKWQALLQWLDHAFAGFGQAMTTWASGGREAV